jgi:hypothetical protein
MRPERAPLSPVEAVREELLAAAAVLLGGGVAVASYWAGRGAVDAPDFAVVPTGLRIRVLGIDGLVLHLVGLPVSRELAGAVLEAALTPEFRRSHAVRRVASYGRRPGQGRSESVFDREMLEQLKSLGYLQ